MKAEIVSFEDVYDEAIPLTEAHWEEIHFGPWKDLDLNITLDYFKEADEMGYLRTIIVRDEGKIVGYVIMLSGEMPHHADVWQAETDVLYVDPEYRGKGVAKLLLAACMEECKKSNIEFFSVVMSTNMDFSDMLEKAGAYLTEKKYTWRV